MKILVTTDRVCVKCSQTTKARDVEFAADFYRNYAGLEIFLCKPCRIIAFAQREVHA